VEKKRIVFGIIGNIVIVAGSHLIWYQPNMPLRHFIGFALLMTAYNLLFILTKGKKE
jgi:hypothetical protein